MCILFIYTNPSPKCGGYRLVIASNRDEYYKRPAKVAYFSAETKIIGGRDMEPGREGGMWLGVSAKGGTLRFGALLNVRGGGSRRPDGRGRGPIVHDYLNSDLSIADYLDALAAPAPAFNSFNFVAVELTKNEGAAIMASHFSNAPESHTAYRGENFLGFGNSTTDRPLAKVNVGKAVFEDVVRTAAANRQDLIDGLLRLLKMPRRNLPDPELQRRVPNDFEELSAIFVEMKQAGYGTRTHSVILVDYDWNIEFIEHTLKEPINIDNPQWEINTIKTVL